MSDYRPGEIEPQGVRLRERPEERHECLRSRTLLGDLRQNLRGSIAAASAPYGYTLSIWSCGAVTMHSLGDPTPGSILLFLGGAALGFLVLAVVVHGQVVVSLTTPEAKRVSLLGITHILSVGLTVLAVWAATSAIDGTAGWPVAGFLATILYLIMTGLQVTLASPEDSPNG